MSLEHQKREDQLNLFKENIKTRQAAEKKRDERLKRQQEIAEYAAGDHKDSNEVYYFFLIKNKI